MKYVAILMPVANLTIEEEFQKYINNSNLVYHIFKMDYKTHRIDGEDLFYDELQKSLFEMTKRISDSAFKYDKIINMCSSLNIRVGVNAYDSNIILKNYLKSMEKQVTLFISPYSKKITTDTLKFLEISPNDILNINLDHSVDYYEFGKNKMKDIVMKHSGVTLVSCTNIPTLDLIHKNNMHIVSTNQTVIEYLNQYK